MKKTLLIPILSATLLLAACNDWLSEISPGTELLDDYLVNGNSAIALTNGCYVPLQWEFGKTYFPEWFIGDVCSDDAQKGGQSVTDMSVAYDMENFKVNADNTYLLMYYQTQFQGIERCNMALSQIPAMEPDEYMDQDLKDRLIGEVRFLRAMYYFRLVRVFGGVPKIDKVVEGSDNWKQSRASAQDIYKMIEKDLLDAEPALWDKSDYPEADLGRATKGAAQAMLLKTYLTGHKHFTNPYGEAEKWGKAVVDAAQAGEYALCDNFFDNFTLAGENGRESIFEIQYTHDPQSDYGGDAGGLGLTRGTFTVILTRSRSQALMGDQTGWGFNRPSADLYEAFETGDPRRDLTIINPTDAQISNPNEDIYLGTRYLNRKYAMTTDGEGGVMYKLPHETRGPINNKVIRYADALLMYAEACVETGNTGQAKWALEEVRNRARGGNAALLPEFPGYNGYSDTAEDLKKAIRHERRVELAMEGHRWFDLNRWGIAHSTMTAFKKKAGNELLAAEMNDFIEGTHELFPIPTEERRLSDLDQNHGYE